MIVVIVVVSDFNFYEVDHCLCLHLTDIWKIWDNDLN